MSEFQKGLVSIVVPTYFSERYLEKCLACLVSQTYPDIEVLVCDGASTDGTVAIIERFERKYPFVRCIHKENEGVSASRNRGMQEAAGEYLQFVDSDDFLLPDACETMVRALEETGADLCIAGFRILKSMEERRPLAGVYEGAAEFARHLPDYYYYKKNCLNTPWNKLYRRERIHAEFPAGLSMGEDLVFNLQVLEGAGKIVVIPDLVYEYNNRNDQSLAYRYRENGFEIETMIHERMLAFADRYSGRDEGGMEASVRDVLYANYLFGLKAKITALVHKSGLSGRECRRRIRTWTRHAAVRDLTVKYHPEGKKDALLLSFFRHHAGFLLYWYYKIMA